MAKRSAVEHDSSAAVPMESLGGSNTDPPATIDRMWLRDSFTPQQIPRFCALLRAKIFDHALRLKLYVDGPRETFEWTVSMCTNLGLLSALIFTSTFSTMFNSDVRALSTSTMGSERAMAYACITTLWLAVGSSACAVAVTIIYIAQGPLFARRDHLGDIVDLLQSNFFYVFLSIFLVCLALIGALLSVNVWLFLAYTTGLAAVLAAVVDALVLVVLALLLRNAIVLNRRSLRFEELVSRGELQTAWATLRSGKDATTEEIVGMWIQHLQQRGGGGGGSRGAVAAQASW